MLTLQLEWPHFVFWAIYAVTALGALIALGNFASGFGVTGAFIGFIFGAGVLVVGSVALVLNTIAYLIWLQWWIPLAILPIAIVAIGYRFRSK